MSWKNYMMGKKDMTDMNIGYIGQVFHKQGKLLPLLRIGVPLLVPYIVPYTFISLSESLIFPESIRSQALRFRFSRLRTSSLAFGSVSCCFDSFRFTDAHTGFAQLLTILCSNRCFLGLCLVGEDTEEIAHE